ncbi:rubrerythrin family protein [Candidatus Latescibacterota bacterium]
MSEKLLNQIIQESIRLELNVAELYKVFNRVFPEDAYFWWTLFEEEENHAALIEHAAKLRIMSEDILSEMLAPSLETLKETNRKILSLAAEYNKNPPARDTAFNVALKIELSAGELHFQKFMSRQNEDDIIVQLFQRLNKDDKDHASRLLEYMSEHDIKTTKITFV